MNFSVIFRCCQVAEWHQLQSGRCRIFSTRLVPMSPSGGHRGAGDSGDGSSVSPCMSVCPCHHVYVCVTMSVPVPPCLCARVTMSMSVSPCLCLCHHVFVCVTMSVSVTRSVCLCHHVCPCHHVYVCVTMCMSVCPSVSPCLCLCLCHHVCPCYHVYVCVTVSVSVSPCLFLCHQVVAIAVLVILVTAPLGAAAIMLSAPRLLSKASQVAPEDDKEPHKVANGDNTA